MGRSASRHNKRYETTGTLRSGRGASRRAFPCRAWERGGKLAA